MRLSLKITTLLTLTIATPLMVPVLPARAQQPDNGQVDGRQLFATTCGWCHSDGGRAAGKGPQLMDNKHDDDFLRNRIKIGKQAAMPAFATTFTDAQIDEIIKYIRELKPHEG